MVPWPGTCTPGRARQSIEQFADSLWQSLRDGSDIASWGRTFLVRTRVNAAPLRVEGGRSSPSLGSAQFERHPIANLVHLGRQDVVGTGALGTVFP
jgi:hypothetical protein